MTSHLDLLAELTKQVAAEEQRADQEQEEDAAREISGDPLDRRDVIMLMISMVIMVFGVWWVAPW